MDQERFTEKMEAIFEKCADETGYSKGTVV